eukprot:s7158_g3.t1
MKRKSTTWKPRCEKFADLRMLPAQLAQLMQPRRRHDNHRSVPVCNGLPRLVSEIRRARPLSSRGRENQTGM